MSNGVLETGDGQCVGVGSVLWPRRAERQAPAHHVSLSPVTTRTAGPSPPLKPAQGTAKCVVTKRCQAINGQALLCLKPDPDPPRPDEYLTKIDEDQIGPTSELAACLR